MWLPAAGRPSESPTRAAHVASAVGGHITAVYWFTSLTSFANPAVTVARMFSDTFAGIAPSSAAMFLVMQLVRGALAYGLVRLLSRRSRRGRGGCRRSRRPPHKEEPKMSDTPVVLFARASTTPATRSPPECSPSTTPRVPSRLARPARTRRTRSSPSSPRSLPTGACRATPRPPTKLDPDVAEAADIVVTMGCGETCPVFPGKRYGTGLSTTPPTRTSRRCVVSLTTSTAGFASS